MNNYIANSKNRKLKKQILGFFERLGFGASKLPFSGRMILVMSAILILSVFFPWFELRFLDGSVDTYSAFSVYTGYIGYLILMAVVAIPFFLLSHTKKERVRAYVPFRLSDAQAIVFIATILATSLFQLLMISRLYGQIAIQGVIVGRGYSIAASSVVLILIASYFLSRGIKEKNTEIYYIDHRRDDGFGEYRDILARGGNTKTDHKDDGNMSLPI